MFKALRFISKLVDVELQQPGITSHGSLKPASQAIPVTAFFGNLRCVKIEQCFVARNQMMRSRASLEVLELFQHIVVVLEKRKLMPPAFPLRRRVRCRAAAGADFCGTSQQQFFFIVVVFAWIAVSVGIPKQQTKLDQPVLNQHLTRLHRIDFRVRHLAPCDNRQSPEADLFKDHDVARDRIPVRLRILSRDQVSGEWFDPFRLNACDGPSKSTAGFNQFAGNEPLRAFGGEC